MKYMDRIKYHNQMAKFTGFWIENEKTIYLCIIFLLLGVIFVIGEVISNSDTIEKEFPSIVKYECWESQKTYLQYNTIRAEEKGISEEDILNITNVYSYDYSISEFKTIQDKFIMIPVKKCCYYIDAEERAYPKWYCNTEIIHGETQK